MTNNQSHKSTWYYGVMVAPAIPWNSNLLEPCALKGARTVLRREGDCEVPDLSDQVHIIGQRNTMADKDIPGIGTHIAVQVEDLEEAKRVLKRRRVKFQEFAPPPSMGLAPVVFVRDPDGNVVELRAEA